MPLTVQTTACRDLINLQIICSITFLNTLRPRQNDQRFTHDIIKRIFSNGNVWSSIKISLKFVYKRPINTIPALVQTMALRRPGDMSSDEPLSEAMLVISPSHIYVIRPQWVSKLSALVWGEVVVLFRTCSLIMTQYWHRLVLDRFMACRLTAPNHESNCLWPEVTRRGS